MKINNIKDIIKSNIVFLFLLLNIFIFIPLNIYLGNNEELVYTFFELIKQPLLVVLGVLLIFNIINYFLNANGRRFLLLLILALSICIWFQSNIFVWNFGLLKGENINFSKSIWLGIIDLSFWILIFVLIMKFSTKAFKYGYYICSVMIVLQISLFTFNIISHKEIFFKKSEGNIDLNTKDGLVDKYKFSKNQNVIHIILDGFQSDIFNEIINEDPAYYNEELKGFTFFKEALSPVGVTFLSVPAIISSKKFTNEQLISDYKKEVFNGENIFKTLKNNGFKVNISAGVYWYENNCKDYNPYIIPTPFVSSKSDLKINKSLILYDLVLFRIAPALLKKYIYNEQSWILQSLFNKNNNSNFEVSSSNLFFKDLTKNIKISEATPCYHFIHLMTPHAPYITKNNGDFSKNALELNIDNFKNQSKYALQMIINFLQKLKKIGIYDNSLIIINSDHGGPFPFSIFRGESKIRSDESLLNHWGLPLALLLIKPINSTGLLKISNNQAELTDLPKTIISLLNISNNFNGENIFSENNFNNRERSYYYTFIDNNDDIRKDFLDKIQYFKINGSVFNESSWSSQVIVKDTILKLKDYQWGDLISFNNNGNAILYEKYGWAEPDDKEGITWNLRNSVELVIPIKNINKPNIEFNINMKPFLFKDKVPYQRIEIYINDVLATQMKIIENEFKNYSFVLSSKSIKNSNELKIEFKFPDAIAPKDVGAGADIRTLAFAFSSMQIMQKD